MRGYRALCGRCWEGRPLPSHDQPFAVACLMWAGFGRAVMCDRAYTTSGPRLYPVPRAPGGGLGSTLSGMGSLTAYRVVVAGVILLSLGACNDGTTAEELEKCMEDRQPTISAAIDAGTDTEQAYQEALEACGNGRLSDIERSKLFTQP